MKAPEKRFIQKTDSDWNRYKTSADGVDSAHWSIAQRCLDGTASEQEYNSLDRCYASYGPEGLTVVSPEMRPITIPPSKKARARFGEMVYGLELAE